MSTMVVDVFVRSVSMELESPLNRLFSKTHWQPDEASKECNTCQEAFSTWMRRRHHCRACGALVCAACSPNFTPLPEFGYNHPVRVCNDCKVVLDYNSSGENASASSDSDGSDFDEQDLEIAYDIVAKRSLSKQSRLSYEYFVKSEAVNWLMDTGLVRTRASGVQLFNRLILEDMIREKKTKEDYFIDIGSNSLLTQTRSALGMCAFYVINDNHFVNEDRVSFYDSTIHSETDKCQNCFSSYLSNLTSTPGFCSIDCKTNSEFHHSDYLRAKKLCVQ